MHLTWWIFDPGCRIDCMGNEGRLSEAVEIWEQVNRKNKFNKPWDFFISPTN